MSTRAPELQNRQAIFRCCALLLCVMTSLPAWAACPKLLMAAGLHIWKQTTPQQATYWGETVGVQGFLVNYVVTDWQTDIGTNENSDKWQTVRQFQTIYSQHGVTDNFIKIALHRAHDWRNPWQNEAVVKDLAHAAALAKYAGFKGVAMDLEPYTPTWGGIAGGPELANRVEQVGREIGDAMHNAYPDMTLIVLPDVLRENEGSEKKRLAGMLNERKLSHGGYGLAVPFLRGLLSARWKDVVIATEQTYGGRKIALPVQKAQQRYMEFLGADNALWTDLSVAPGLWPLGPSKWDKSPRETPESFKQRLQEAFEVSKQYVWIYGSNSAWQTDGPLGPIPGPVTANFQQYVAAVHQVVASCGASSDSSSVPRAEPAAHVVPPRASGEPMRAVGSVQHSAGAVRPAGTLPRVRVLRPADQGHLATEIP